MNIDQLKAISKQSFDMSLQKANAIKKAESDQILVYNNHIFRADAETICFVRTASEGRSSFFMLDSNSNPVEITDPTEFLDLLLQRNQSALNTYHQLYQNIKNRKV
jgi:hypothetical protein